MNIVEELDELLSSYPSEAVEYVLWDIWNTIEKHSSKPAVRKFIDDLTLRLLETVDLSEILRESVR